MGSKRLITAGNASFLVFKMVKTIVLNFEILYTVHLNMNLRMSASHLHCLPEELFMISFASIVALVIALLNTVIIISIWFLKLFFTILFKDLGCVYFYLIKDACKQCAIL